MRKYITLLPAAALLVTPAFAQARGFDADFSKAVTGPFKLEVVVSEDLAHRANNLPKKLSDRGKRGLTLSENAPTLLRVTIVEVKNNRPTFNQLSQDIGLSFKSFGIGGADVSAEFISAGGTVIGSAEYDYYSNLNDGFNQGRAVWADTTRAFSRFSKKLSKKLAAMDTTSS